MLGQTKARNNVADLRTEMQALMMDQVGVFRTEEGIQSALNRIRELQESAQDITVMDKGKRFNTDILEAIELQNLLDLAEVTAASALARTESRGAHSREDHKARDDENWLTHTYASKVDGKVSLGLRTGEYHYPPSHGANLLTCASKCEFADSIRRPIPSPGGESIGWMWKGATACSMLCTR